MTGIGGDALDERPPVYKAVGVALAIASGVFIGVSFVLKKKGLLAANLKDNKEAGEGYGYLKNVWWWAGMILMIVGEICNFCAYAFVEAILVTPLGALSVVITAVLSSIFLKERLSFVGKIGCFMCLVGSVVIVVNAPTQTSVNRIEDMQRFVIAPGFLSYAGVVILGCAAIVVWVAPKWGNKSMMVYITICSLIGGLSVVATQGLGAAVLAQTRGVSQFNQWFLYVLLVFVIVTLLVEIVYLNKALNIYNAALVTPTYYVCFTSATIVTSAILFQGFKGSAASISTVVMGFLQICSGVVLLQLSKSAKDVPDTAIFRGDLDQVHTIAEQTEPESEPKADTIRGTAAIIRRISVARRAAEAEEAKRIQEGRMRDLHTPLSSHESVEWDGVRRRVTYVGDNPMNRRRNTLSGQHPPLGMSRTPVIPEDGPIEGSRRRSMSVDEAMRQQVYPDLEQQLPPQHDDHPETILERVKGLFVPKVRSKSSLNSSEPYRESVSPPPPPPPPHRTRFYSDATIRSPQPPTITESSAELKTYDFAPSHHLQPDYAPVSNPADNSVLRPDSRGAARRQFSFQNILHRPRSSPIVEAAVDGSAHAWRKSPDQKTEEEMLGLVKGISIERDQRRGLVRSVAQSDDEDDIDEYDDRKRNWEKEAR